MFASLFCHEIVAVGGNLSGRRDCQRTRNLTGPLPVQPTQRPFSSPRPRRGIFHRRRWQSETVKRRAALHRNHDHLNLLIAQAKAHGRCTWYPNRHYTTCFKYDDIKVNSRRKQDLTSSVVGLLTRPDLPPLWVSYEEKKLVEADHADSKFDSISCAQLARPTRNRERQRNT